MEKMKLENVILDEVKVLHLEPGDNLFVTIDPEKYGVECAQQIFKNLEKYFPKNTVVVKIKGVEVDG